MTEDMIAILICEKQGWTWQEYDSQPGWFIDGLRIKMLAESKEARKETMRAKTRGY